MLRVHKIIKLCEQIKKDIWGFLRLVNSWNAQDNPWIVPIHETRPTIGAYLFCIIAQRFVYIFGPKMGGVFCLAEIGESKFLCIFQND